MLAFTTQVLLRPSRIGTLLVLAGMIGVVVVGAEGWWIVLGIALFQTAACALTVVWIDLAEIVRSRQPAGLHDAEYGLAQRWPERHCRAVVTVPRPRRPRADECRD
jgi:hypothetical protein